MLVKRKNKKFPSFCVNRPSFGRNTRFFMPKEGYP
nr:MAG TPA: hypothetical protein [Caudoviricetes sp.]